jgi:hypothetical protein
VKTEAVPSSVFTTVRISGHTKCMFFKFLQSLIPLKEEWDMKSDEKKTSESYRLVCEENKEIMEVSGFILNFLSHKL